MTPAWIDNCIDFFSSQMTLNLDGDNDQDWEHMGTYGTQIINYQLFGCFVHKITRMIFWFINFLDVLLSQSGNRWLLFMLKIINSELKI